MGFIDTKSSSYSGPNTRKAVTSTKSDMSLPQHGGEGGGKEGDVDGGHNDIGFTPKRTVDTNYTGKGRNLQCEEF